MNLGTPENSAIQKLSIIIIIRAELYGSWKKNNLKQQWLLLALWKKLQTNKTFNNKKKLFIRTNWQRQGSRDQRSPSLTRDQKIKRSRGGRWSWTSKLAHKRSSVGRWSWAAKVKLLSLRVVPQQLCNGHCPCDSAQARQLKQQLRSALVAGQWREDTALKEKSKVFKYAKWPSKWFTNESLVWDLMK